jgi:hypothetical protein
VLDVPGSVLIQADAQRRRELVEQVRSGFRVELASTLHSPRTEVEDLGRGENAVDVVSVRFDLGAASAIRFVSSDALGDVAIEVVDTGRTFRERVVLAAGERSREIDLGLRPTLVPTPTPDARVVPPGEPRTTPTATSLVDYLRMGFFHIVPEGIDHLLFVASMVLLVRKAAPLLWLVSLFTLGHAISVTLSVYGIAALGAGWVEPLIALSLAYGALEWRRPAFSVARPAVTLGFGLVHGLGFAGALGRVGVPEAERAVAILGFNLGVEAGQVTVALVPLLALLWLEPHRDTDAVRWHSLVAIAAIGVSWAGLRLAGVEV